MPAISGGPSNGSPLPGGLHGASPSAIQELLPLVDGPGLLSFALGLPAPELLPAADLSAAAVTLGADPTAFQYGPADIGLKAHIVEVMRTRGVDCREEQLFLTIGAQQALYLLVCLLLAPGGQILTEEQVYPGFQQVVASRRPQVVTVPTDPATGMDVGAVAAAMRGGARPACIYAVAEGHNPLGVSMAPATRAGLIAVAREYGVPIIEDDPYGFLYYGELPAPPLRALDAECVYYVGSFSKIVSPALRVGWIVAPEWLLPGLAILKEASDLDVATFSQRVLTAYLATGALPDHLRALRVAYRARRDALDAALRAHFPPGSQWVVPGSGLFIWVALPDGTDTGPLLRAAVEQEQIAFMPGAAFASGTAPPAARCLRLCFSSCPADRIEDGIARLARVFAMAH